MAKRNAFYAQSGGVTAVINASACGVIETARKHGDAIGTVFAGRNGIIGALTEDLIDTGHESDAAIAALRHTPSGAFGSCRYKLKTVDKDPREYERLIEVFKAHDIGYFFYNGGGDSADTCLKVSQLSEQSGVPIQAIHVPKTVDNDLPITDNCPGFGSVAKYIAVSTREASFDVRSMAATSTKVFVLEVMGRHAGWIAAAGGLASDATHRDPHRHPLPRDRLRPGAVPGQGEVAGGEVRVLHGGGLRGREERRTARSWPIRGSRTPSATPNSAAWRPWSPTSCREGLGLKYHWGVADYLQRPRATSPPRPTWSRPTPWARAAVELALAGKNSRDAHHRAHVQTAPTPGRSGAAPLSDVANVEKMMPREYITEDGFGITEACREYLTPLIQGEDYPPYKDGLPRLRDAQERGGAERLPEFKL